MASKGKIKKFVKPNLREVTAAIGVDESKCQFMEFLQKCSGVRSSATSVDLFPPIETPGPNDWLRNFRTEAEPFYVWQRKIRNHVIPRVRTIYILPLGKFTADKTALVAADCSVKAEVKTKFDENNRDHDKNSGSDSSGYHKMDAVGQVFLQALRNYTQLFFPGMIVKLLKEVPLSKLKCQSRFHAVDYGVTREQLMIPGIFGYMKSILPQDAYCMLAVTMVDLYPNDNYTLDKHP